MIINDILLLHVSSHWEKVNLKVNFVFILNNPEFFPVEAVSHLIFHSLVQNVEGSVSVISVRAMHSRRSWSSACFGQFVHPLAAEQKLTLVAFQTMTVFKTLVIKISVTTVLKCSLLKRESNVLNNLLKEEWNTSII